MQNQDWEPQTVTDYAHDVRKQIIHWGVNAFCMVWLHLKPHWKLVTWTSCGAKTSFPSCAPNKATLETFPPPGLWFSMMSCGTEYPFGQFGPSFLPVSPAASCPPPGLLTERAVWEAEKALTLYKHCSPAIKTLMCYQYGFDHKCRP